MYRQTDVFVIGGGPAGLAAAIAAARKGFSVTVADGAEPPIDKPCGEGMMPETQAALENLGVELPALAGWNFRGVRFVQEQSELAADFPQGSGIGIRRPLLHAVLIEAAQKRGVHLLWKTAVSGIESGGVRLGNDFASARWIVGADGSVSRVRKWAELERTITRTQRMATRRHYRVRPWSEYMEIHWGRHAQAYVTPIARDEVCIVTMGDSTDDVKFGPMLRGAVTVMHRLHRVARANVALVGDASGGVDAITGEGLRLAFRQAAALADAMQTSDLAEYQRAHSELLQRPSRMGRLLVEFGRREGLRARVIRAMRRRPELFGKMLAIYAGRAGSMEILRTSAQLGLQFIAA